MSTLRPCPFCGGTRISQMLNVSLFARCKTCGAHGPVVHFPDNRPPNDGDWEKVEAAWNSRKSSNPSPDITEMMNG